VKLEPDIVEDLCKMHNYFVNRTDIVGNPTTCNLIKNIKINVFQILKEIPNENGLYDFKKIDLNKDYGDPNIIAEKFIDLVKFIYQLKSYQNPADNFMFGKVNIFFLISIRLLKNIGGFISNLISCKSNDEKWGEKFKEMDNQITQVASKSGYPMRIFRYQSSFETAMSITQHELEDLKQKIEPPCKIL